MGFLLLWIESLAVSLLFMAWVFACVGRWHRRWRRATVWMLAGLALLLPYSFMVLFSTVLMFGLLWFYYFLGLAIFFLLGVIVLRILALKRTETPEGPTVAAQWPRAKLFVAWCVAMVLHAATIGNLDNAAYRHIEATRDDAKKTLLAVVPPSVADADNALPIYEKAAEAFQCWTGNEQVWFEKKAASFDAKDPELQAFMREREPVARLLHEAAKRPACVFPLDPNEPGRKLFSPAEGVFSDMALFLSVHCRCKLAEGNPQAAWQDMHALFQMSKQNSTGVNLWGCTFEKQAVQSLQYVLAEYRPLWDELDALKIDEFFSWRRAMRENLSQMEASCWEIITLPGIKNSEECEKIGLRYPPAQEIVMNTPLYRIFFFPIDEALYRRVMEETEIRLMWPYHQATGFPIVGEEVLRNPYEAGSLVFGPTRLNGVLDYPKLCAEADARHAMALIALAIAKYQAKHGQMPKNLDALVPEFLTIVPIDPFDGKPMKFKTTDSGVEIYSVGRDAAEVESFVKGAQKKPNKDDLTFKLPRVISSATP